MTQTASPASGAETQPNPWPALWALCLGFFMILVDTTIVTVATPAIMDDLDANVTAVVWVTSAYLLAYAVPVLITGRLGDRFGPKRLYLTGLVVFTLASLWCGLTGTIEGLIWARVAQGLGASMMTPQTMAVITRTFPVDRRGSAMALWGATAGVATLVGPILGGVLVDSLGWEWIFFINLPVGLLAFVLAWRLVPALETHSHRFDWLGVALSGVGMFLLVFGLQEGQQYEWGRITGPVTVWRMIVAGLVVLAVFIWWQARNRKEPLVPLGLFRDRNFSLSNVAITTVSFGFTAMGFPLMLYTQLVRGWTPTQSGLLLVPLAVSSIVLAPWVGRMSDRVHPRVLTSFGFVAMGGSLAWLALALGPRTPVWQLLLPLATLGIGSAFLWSVLSTTANRNLPVQQAGAGAGVYNATRQVGAVLGSAAIAVLMESRLSAHGLGVGAGVSAETAGAAGGLPEAAWPAFSQAMGESLLLLPAVLLVGLFAVLGFESMKHAR